MDVVVNAVWLALYWARKEGNDEAVSALKLPILDWPMDFVWIQGSTPEEREENSFKWTVNMSAKVERLRDFVGLENVNLMRIVMVAADIAKAKLVSGKKANAEFVHTWLVDNVRWGAFQCPDVSTVERHMVNWGAIQKNGRAVELIESAVQRWGRNNLGLSDETCGDRCQDRSDFAMLCRRSVVHPNVAKGCVRPIRG